MSGRVTVYCRTKCGVRKMRTTDDDDDDELVQLLFELLERKRQKIERRLTRSKKRWPVAAIELLAKKR
jgi:hypothetical protein